jgi:alkanesulfonate monooxygenase SsuD/methylene tetrahydromethanopterin reductase-like flavin-dependent oxidoreductase (luciferase family)
MRIGIVTVPSAAETGSNVVDYVTTIARQVEALGFHGVWVTDAFARGKPTLDPLILLGALATQTSRIELGTCVVQVPLRHPVEHAQRVLTLTALAQGRFRFGVGSGSTRSDFDAVQADYDARFKTLTASLEVCDGCGPASRFTALPCPSGPELKAAPRFCSVHGVASGGSICRRRCCKGGSHQGSIRRGTT